jgi:hypothetical protein
MVAFETFWRRLQEQLSVLPEKDGYHYGEVEKWSCDKGRLGKSFVSLYKGGDVIYAQTESTDSIRNIASSEFAKVYEVWRGYRSGEVPRSYIVNELGVQNSSWIIPMLKQHEPLMSECPVKKDDILKSLEACTWLSHEPSRKLAPIGVITKAFQHIGVTPFIFGGAAVEWHLSGHHEASDIDLRCNYPLLLRDQLQEIGFELESFDHLSHPLLPLDIHLAIDEASVADERTTVVDIAGYKVHIITVFQAILDYLHKFIEGPSNLEPVFVGDLLEKYSSTIDINLLLERAKDYGSEHFHALRAIIAYSLNRIIPP